MCGREDVCSFQELELPMEICSLCVSRVYNVWVVKFVGWLNVSCCVLLY